ncbi:MAG: SUMF1/EgtB/PvdO family nonheme iron enzyme [Halieaceae bacterium]|nr:SUMF1/EgtB/PvdO family nonheme iron enzyme [Halieaceae bacterium]
MSWLNPEPPDLDTYAALNQQDDSVRLARLLAPALRIDTTLLRNMRMRYLPGTNAGLESALWFDNLVMSRSARAISFSPGVARLLTDALDAEARLSTITDFIESQIADWPAELRLEQQLRLAARIDDTGSIQLGLRKVLGWFEHAASDDDRVEILRWARAALPRLIKPEWQLQEAQWLIQLAAATLGDTTGELERASKSAEGLPGWLGSRLQQSGNGELGLNLRPGQLEFVDAGAGAHNLPVGPVIPALLGIKTPGNDKTRWERVWAGQVLAIPADAEQLELITLSGQRYELKIEHDDTARDRSETAAAVQDLPKRIRLLHLPEEGKAAEELAGRLDAMGISVNTETYRPHGASRTTDDDTPVIRLWSRRSAKYYSDANESEEAFPGLVVRLDDVPLPQGRHDIASIDLFGDDGRFSEHGLEQLREKLDSEMRSPTIWLAFGPNDREQAWQLRGQLESNGINSLDRNDVRQTEEPGNPVEMSMRRSDAVFVLQTSGPLRKGDDRIDEIETARRCQLPLFHVETGIPATETGLFTAGDAVLSLEEVQSLSPRILKQQLDEWHERRAASQTKGHIFISYYHDGDINQGWAQRIETRLNEQGFEVWRDVDEIQPGEDFSSRISSALQRSSLLLCVVCDSFFESEWAKHEIDMAREHNIPILPVNIEDGYRPSSEFADLQHLDMHPDDPQAWDRLFEFVGRYVQPNPPDAEIQNSAEPGQAIPETFASNVQALIDQLDDPSTEPKERLANGDELARLGDPRPGVGLDQDGLPDIDWVEILGGEFLYGEDKQASHLETFLIARYPVTNAQYQAFIDDDGYKNKRWWQRLAEHPEPASPEWGQSNRPRETINWHEAVAYCRWLSDKLGYAVELPKETQWERAASGATGQAYPWGDAYQSGYANVDETKEKAGQYYLEQTSAVGIYPQGASLEGVHELIGNVWEWCLNKYENPENEALDGDEPRVLRGGSWLNDPDFARASLRYGYDPDDRLDGIGFRVVCSSPITR